MKQILSALALAFIVCALELAAATMQTPSLSLDPRAHDQEVQKTLAPKKENPKEPPAKGADQPKSEGADKTAKSAKPPTDPKTSTPQKKTSEPEKKSAPLISAAANPREGEAKAPPSMSDAPAKSNPAIAPAPSALSAPKNDPAPANAKEATPAQSSTPLSLVTPASSNLPDIMPSPATTTAPTKPAAALPLTETYRVGSGDVLDIRLLNQTGTRESTLYTVMSSGLIEYPLIGEPLVARGLTTEEIAATVAAELKRRALFSTPQISVNVRDYASHTILVSGLVTHPGTKILRYEAIPFYLIIAEAQPYPDASRAVIISRATGLSTTVDFSNLAAMNMHVQAGDVIQVQTRPKEYLYLGGQVQSGGQKDFQPGLTLTQALLAAGGVTRLAGKIVRVSRQGADGRLVAVEYKLKEIEAGIVPDPTLLPGDRVEVQARK